MDTSNNVTSSYLDFGGLGELRGRAAKDSQGALRETAEQFEALFIQMMLKSMREATFKSDMLQSDALDTYQDMFDKEMSVSMAARGNMGVASMLQHQLGQESARLSASVALDAADTPRPLHNEQAPMSVPNTRAATNASGNGLPLSGHTVGQPMPMPSHWTRQTPVDKPRTGEAS